ncbi:hypothetical protein HMPREF1531_00233 [Propionibacterium sp. oral taxon 192 str. F0372]|uniref:NADH-quinone oxidoreductase subunit NuoH n=1 Tax=Propionibacterium sp. oral taxon 192 TaxID=671222 RepID=UPI000352B111|nr:NADH-quinone oxidoreductase subunit NuoH [Propionibacterium sp. oral taxon 192]EPH07180.1 hypothetical protein HMPREF1531_00233 [Propionibacterium sp. oral taxon 192 str. F0372]
MTPLEAVFGTDPWWIVLIKVIGVFALLLVWTIFNVWFERRILGKMQNRKGPIMNGPFGLGQAMGDGVKLLLKEDFRPARTDAVVFSVAPALTAVAAFSSWAVIPLGGTVRMFGHETHLQLTDFPVAALLVMAIAGVGFYGFVLAGWASNGTYSLLGSMRATAQVISYEIAMGLSLVAVFLYASTMSTSEIVKAQGVTISMFGVDTPLPSWYGLLLFPSFLVYVIAMFGETNRQPFDMPECESEIVSGHITDYSGFRYALFFLAEYINCATVSAVSVTLFLGGYGAPWPFNGTFLNEGWWTLLWFVLKVQAMMFFFSWVRGSLPRVRYDQMMSLGWKVLIPGSLGWITLLALTRGSFIHRWTSPLVWVGVVVIMVIAVWAVFRASDEGEPAVVSVPAAAGEVFDAFADGYPVPPMPGTNLIEGVVVPASDSTARTASMNGADV